MIFTICLATVYSFLLWGLIAYLVTRPSFADIKFRKDVFNKSEWGRQSVWDLTFGEIAMSLFFIASVTWGAIMASSLSRPSLVFRHAVVAAIFGALIWILLIEPLLAKFGHRIHIPNRWTPVVLFSLFFTTTGFLVSINAYSVTQSIQVSAKVGRIGPSKQNFFRSLFSEDGAIATSRIQITYETPIEFDPMADEIKLTGNIPTQDLATAQASGIPLKISK